MDKQSFADNKDIEANEEVIIRPYINQRTERLSEEYALKNWKNFS